jgi:RNA ligase
VGFLLFDTLGSLLHSYIPMKIDLESIDKESFMVHQHNIGEHEVTLVQPIHLGATWTKDNLIFRSSVWDKEGNPVSLSFKKFFNWDESPVIDPAPSNLDGAKLMEKLDGSTLIVSRYKGITVMRTRGTVDAHSQPNGDELSFLREKYDHFFEHIEGMENTPVSYIFEWLSPSNRIVLDYGEDPDIVLIGAIYHNDYTMMKQESLDTMASQLQLRRPKVYSYSSIEEMKQSVEVLRDKEGLCVYYNDDQCIRKVKSAHYLYLHRAKSEISSIDKVIDVYIDWFMEYKRSHESTGYSEFFEYLTKKFDHEIATMAQGHSTRICDAMVEVKKIMSELVLFSFDRINIPRKQAAAEILQAYGSTGRAAIVFKMLDAKYIGADDYKKILYQVLK